MGRGLLRIICPCLRYDDKQDSSQPELPAKEQSSSEQGCEYCGSSDRQNENLNVDRSPDLRQSAYNDLDEKSRSKLNSSKKAGKNDDLSGTTGVVENVIARMKEGYWQYEIHAYGLTINLGHRKKIDVRATAHRVLRSFQGDSQCWSGFRSDGPCIECMGSGVAWPYYDSNSSRPT